MLVLGYTSLFSPTLARDRSFSAFTLRVSFITSPGRMAFAGKDRVPSFLVGFFMIFCVRLAQQPVFLVFLASSLQLQVARPLKSFSLPLVQPLQLPYAP